MRCPLCGKEAETARGLTKHLKGGQRYGGHDLTEPEALRRVAEAASAPAVVELEPQELTTIAVEQQPNPEQRSGFVYAALRRLVANKELPKYQFERIIDGFLGMFLGMFLADIVQNVQTAQHVDLVAQEFPLKKPGTCIWRAGWSAL